MTRHSLPKRVLAIHDICGVGRCSLVSAISILSHLGSSVCPLSTATFSVNTSFPDFKWEDLSQTLMPFIEDYHDKGIHFDSIYSGYLGNEKQVEAIFKAITLWRHAYQVVDPVFADNGKLYAHFDLSIVDSFQELIQHADLITPNITEASYLLTRKANQITNLEEAKEALLALSNNRKRNVIITSVEDSNLPQKVGIIAFDRERESRFEFFAQKQENASFCGTGDVLTSSLLGLMLSGLSFEESLSRAFRFINDSITYTLSLKGNVREGIIFEPCLKNLCS